MLWVNTSVNSPRLGQVSGDDDDDDDDDAVADA